MLAIVALAFGHGLIASWEDALLRGELSVTEALERTVRWLMLVSIQLGPAMVLIRIRRAQIREPTAPTATHSEPPDGPGPPPELVEKTPSQTPSRRNTPRVEAANRTGAGRRDVAIATGTRRAGS